MTVETAAVERVVEVAVLSSDRSKGKERTRKELYRLNNGEAEDDARAANNSMSRIFRMSSNMCRDEYPDNRSTSFRNYAWGESERMRFGRFDMRPLAILIVQSTFSDDDDRGHLQAIPPHMSLRLRGEEVNAANGSTSVNWSIHGFPIDRENFESEGHYFHTFSDPVSFSVRLFEPLTVVTAELTYGCGREVVFERDDHAETVLWMEVRPSTIWHRAGQTREEAPPQQTRVSQLRQAWFFPTRSTVSEAAREGALRRETVLSRTRTFSYLDFTDRSSDRPLGRRCCRIAPRINFPPGVPGRVWHNEQVVADEDDADDSDSDGDAGENGRVVRRRTRTTTRRGWAAILRDAWRHHCETVVTSSSDEGGSTSSDSSDFL